jgi:hypothetical protein
MSKITKEWKWIYRNEKVDIFYAELVKEYSKMGESEGDFRGRLAHSAREMREQAVAELKEKFLKKMASIEDQLERAMITMDREESEAANAKIQMTGNVVGSVMGMIFGKRKMSSSLLSKGRMAASSYGRASKQSDDVRRAEMKVEDLRGELADLESVMRDELDILVGRFDPMRLVLETLQIKPYKKDIDIQSVSLLWVPFDERDMMIEG